MKYKSANKGAGIEENEVISTMFRLCRADDSGEKVFETTLDGGEFFETVCPGCRKLFRLDFYDFCRHMCDGDIFGTSVYCPECSKNKLNERKTTGNSGTILSIAHALEAKRKEEPGQN